LCSTHQVADTALVGVDDFFCCSRKFDLRLGRQAQIDDNTPDLGVEYLPADFAKWNSPCPNYTIPRSTIYDNNGPENAPFYGVVPPIRALLQTVSGRPKNA